MKVLTFVCAVCVLLTGSIALAQPDPASLSLDADTYYDKTLAGILGQVGGFLSGYEFVTAEALPDEWFRLTYGPYSGDSPFHAVTDYPGYDRLFEDGRVGSDDDYHVDFFNQLILERYGVRPAFRDIQAAWRQHQVGDWGGGSEAMRLMNERMLPPQVGSAEYNQFYWVSEPYIETETLGMNAPGMPATARDLAVRFASVVGEFDSQVWAEFWATAYALAYFETDAAAVLEKAAAVIPTDTWPAVVYAHMLSLYAQYPDNWRAAQAEIQAYSRPIYRIDNPLVIGDMNNAMAIMALLYGENDFMTTARIASLSGFDADCTAATALGLMGILQGMEAMPEEILTRVSASGEGVYVNDTVSGFPPFIAYDYPEEQRWTDIAALYQRNAEQQIVAYGGSVSGGVYTIAVQSVPRVEVVSISNHDFETGTLDGWTATGAQVVAEANSDIENGPNMAQSGTYKGVLLTEGQAAELFTTLIGLEAGATYHASAFVQADEAARFFVRQGGETLWSGVSHTLGLPNREWARRDIEFVAQADGTAEIGLAVLAGEATRAGIDNLVVRRVDAVNAARYEAESAELTGITAGVNGVIGWTERDTAINFAVDAPVDGEYGLDVYYANGDSRAVRLWVVTNEVDEAMVPFAPTGPGAEFSRSRVQIPVVLHAGGNTVRLERRRTGEPVHIDAVELTGP
jgi:hypothetical protein